MIPVKETETPLNCSEIRSLPKSSSHKQAQKISFKDEREKRHLKNTKQTMVRRSGTIKEKSRMGESLSKNVTAPTPIAKRTRFEKKMDSSKFQESPYIKGRKNKVIIKPDIYQRFYSRWKEFEKLPQFDLEKPSVSISGPYLADKDLWKNDKDKWLGGKNFNLIFGRKASRESANFIKNYVGLEPSKPPILHKFREEERQKWIDKSGFLA
jgi:hypothetical protein